MAARPDARVPRHLAIVMDGNGRWAKQRLRPRTFGHHAGQKAVKEAVEFCLRRGIASLTLFAFSSENWQRPATEVSALMELFLKALDKEVDELHGNGVRVRFVGNLDAFAPELRNRMLGAMDRTAANTALNMNVAVNYGGRWDIANAARLAAEAVARGELAAADLDEVALNRYTCLADQPPLDLFIRTGGGSADSAHRLFMSPQSAMRRSRGCRAPRNALRSPRATSSSTSCRKKTRSSS